MRTKKFAKMILLGTVLLGARAAMADSATYALTRTIKVGGDGRWDYVTVDPASHQLYVTRSTHMQVLNTAGEVVGDIKDLGGTHGVAIAADAGRGFISDGEKAALVVFDLKTNAVLGKVDAAEDADGIIYDPGTKLVLTSCGDAKQLVTFPADGDVKTTKATLIDVGGKPEFLAADGEGKAYVTVNDTNEIAVVDLKTSKVVSRWTIGAGTKPTGVAIDAKNHRLFIGCRNKKMIVLNTEDGKALADLPIGQGNDACAFDAETGEAFASCGDSTVTVVKETAPGKFEVTQTIATKPGARTMTVDPSTHTLYLPTAEFGPAEAGQRRPPMKPGTFMILVVEPKK